MAGETQANPAGWPQRSADLELAPDWPKVYRDHQKNLNRIARRVGLLYGSVGGLLAGIIVTAILATLR